MHYLCVHNNIAKSIMTTNPVEKKRFGFLADLIVIVCFAVISIAYFLPAALEGRTLFQHDTVAGVGAGQESVEYLERTGERTRWTNALFGGMPTYQIAPSYNSTKPLNWFQKAYQLFLPSYAWLPFIMMFGFYILLRAFGIPAWLSGLGGLMWAFSSYFFILIAAGHIWKFVTLAYIPPTIAGVVLAYRKHYLAGGVVTALFLALQIMSNHVQMSYYFLFVMLFMAIAYFVDAQKNHELPHFFKASGVLLVAALIGISANLSNLYHTYQYSKETMRGKSELVQQNASASSQNSGGLDRDYITQWSYGIGETATLLIPDARGGASAPLSQSETAMEKANPMYGMLYNQLTQYFGTQPMTAGPVYVGAFVLALFILGCFIVKGPMKWALLGATIFSILLSWGKNFMPLTDFFIDYIPMYNKFRAVSSILVIAEFTIPLLAILTLKEILQKPQVLSQQKVAVVVTLALTLGVSLVYAVAPDIFVNSYFSMPELNALQNGIPEAQLVPILDNLAEMRANMVSSDAWRSFFVVFIGAAIVYLYKAGKMKSTWTIILIAALCTADMWNVNKRYLNDSLFTDNSVKENTFRQTDTDKIILQDKNLDYRVLNFASNTFNENNTSYWHKSVGGYHAAKLRRYQDMIDHYIAPQMQQAIGEIVSTNGEMTQADEEKFKVINMLNTRYFIFPIDQQGHTAPIENPYAFGNAWFVDKVNLVNNANEEIDAIAHTPLRTTAVVDKRFADVVGHLTYTSHDADAYIRIESYEPNHLVYTSSSACDKAAVFSEIYYPGWKASIDGKPVEVGRANYILRTLAVPAGQHTIEMRFDPTSIHVTETIAYVAVVLLGLGVVLLLMAGYRNYRREKAPMEP